MAARTLTRRESKQLTRRRLVDGTIDILRSEGVAAATTGRVAAAAGIKQSSFYGHFPDRDACLAAAADHIGSFVVEKIRAQRARFDADDLYATVRRGISSVVAAFLAEPELTRIFLRYRSDDDSAMGRTFRSQVDEARDDLQKDLRLFGIARDAGEAMVYADLLVAGTLGVIEGLIVGRITDRDVAIDGMARVTYAAVRAARDKQEEQ